MATTQQYIDQLKIDKQNLVSMLNNMGVEASNNETFTSLTPKIGTIVTDPILQDKSIEIIENGTQTISADEGYNGLNNVEVITNVASSGGSEMYSSEELEIGTWINGEKLYRRVITGKIGGTLNKWNQLAQFPFRQVTKISGVWGMSFANEQYPVPYSIGTEFLTINGISNNHTICEYHNYAYPSGGTIQVIVEYIK